VEAEGPGPGERAGKSGDRHDLAMLRIHDVADARRAGAGRVFLGYYRGPTLFYDNVDR
jgi:hypothetical protein